MPIQYYGVLKGQIVDTDPENQYIRTPHYQIRMKAGEDSYRVAVNVRSTDRSTPALLYSIQEHFTHPVLAQLLGLNAGFQDLQSEPGGMALDYIRGNLVQIGDMPVAPPTRGPENYLEQQLDAMLQRARGATDVDVYAFGQRWGPDTDSRNEGPDPVFGLTPNQGVHDIHMNQGNPPGDHDGDNGTYQDGALFVHFKEDDTWTAIFLAFQSQAETLTGQGAPNGDGESS